MSRTWLAGVCVERHRRPSSCAVRSPDDALWDFKNDRDPWCLGRDIGDVLSGQETDFKGVCADIPQSRDVYLSEMHLAARAAQTRELVMKTLRQSG